MDNKITFNGLGPKEAELVARLTYEKKTIISIKELDSFLPVNYKYRNQFVYNLKQKKIFAPIKRGYYVFTPLESIPSGIRVNEFLIPPIFFPRKNYYIGYSTMFNYYNLTEQLFQKIYVLNTSLSQEKIICGVSYKFIKISEDRMYGQEIVRIRDTEVMVSSKERTLIDLIYFNKPIGGINSAIEIFRKVVAEKKCNIKKLIEFAVFFPNITVRKRIGVILENIGINKAYLKPIIKSIEKTAISSFSGSRKGSLNKTWRVIINAT